jgi:CheY-like chemotaxis protein
MSKSLRILVVDDDVDAADSLAELFEMEGHEVKVAYSGEKAIEAYRTSNFDIAFMDIMMPGKNGVESFFEIKQLRPDAQVYMMTGYSVEQLIQQAIEHGAMGVLNKPVDLDKVLAALEEAKPSGIVLIVEDDPEFGPQLERIISEAGFRCALVRNGKEALERVRAGGVGVLILDLKLPVIDGIEVYHTLRREHREVPTIIITGHADENQDLLAAMQDVTVTGVLNKPFDPGMLLEKLHKLAA